MLSDQEVKAITTEVHARPDLNGCVIGYEGDGMSRVLHAGNPRSANFGRVIVMIEEVEFSDGEAGQIRAGDAPKTLPTQPAPLNNRSRLTRELVGAGVNCGMTVVSAVGVAGAGALEAPSGGTSTVLLVLAWSGMISSGVQCVNGVARSAQAIWNPGGMTLSEWDQNTLYSKTMLVVDAVGVVSSVAAIPVTGWKVLATLEKHSAGFSAQALFKLSRAERAERIAKAVADANRSPEGRAALRQALKEAGVSEGKLQNATVRGFNHPATYAAGKAAGNASGIAIRRAGVQELQKSIRDALLATSFSALPEEWAGSASGSVNALIVHVMNQ